MPTTQAFDKAGKQAKVCKQVDKQIEARIVLSQTPTALNTVYLTQPLTATALQCLRIRNWMLSADRFDEGQQ